MQHQVNLRGEKKHHDTIRDLMAASSHVFPLSYMAVGYLLFLQEQIKGIIIRARSIDVSASPARLLSKPSVSVCLWRLFSQMLAPPQSLQVFLWW